jgi:hypothetical protein
MKESLFELEPIPIYVPDDLLADLRTRLKSIRWPLDAGNDDGYYGVSRSYLEGLVDYWINEFDWRKSEAAINVYEHYKVNVDGVPVHFMRKPGVGPNPIPLILTHGWPWTFWHWSKVIDPLADPGASLNDGQDGATMTETSKMSFRRMTSLHMRQSLGLITPSKPRCATTRTPTVTRGHPLTIDGRS